MLLYAGLIIAQFPPAAIRTDISHLTLAPLISDVAWRGSLSFPLAYQSPPCRAEREGGLGLTEGAL